MRAIFTFLGLTPKDEVCSPLGKSAFALRNISVKEKYLFWGGGGSRGSVPATVVT